jgi:hypothetical protein
VKNTFGRYLAVLRSLGLILCLLPIVGVPNSARQAAPAPPPVASAPLPDALTAAEFGRLVTELSEPGGDFLSDNLVSNETGYVPVLERLKELEARGGAYIGVGPEQNFTYIAAIRPRIAFIVDLRRLAVTQHLMYKAIFQLAPDRAQFLSRLLSRPLAGDAAPTAGSSADDLLAYFGRVAADSKLYAANLADIRNLIQQQFQVAFSDSDAKGLEYLLGQFRDDGIEIAFRLDNGWQNTFPSLREVVAQSDRSGKRRHFLASREDYEYRRQLQLRNLIVPVNGDFGGTKALAGVGAYLASRGVTVSAFYLSNVEQYVFGDGTFDAFVRNVRRLPVDERSLFIRSVLDRYMPAQAPRRLFTMMLQRIPVFLEDYEARRYRYYHELVTTNSIVVNP